MFAWGHEQALRNELISLDLDHTNWITAQIGSQMQYKVRFEKRYQRRTRRVFEVTTGKSATIRCSLRLRASPDSVLFSVLDVDVLRLFEIRK